MEPDGAKVSEREHLDAERLRFALEGALDGLWDWDIPGGSMYVSPRYEAILGYAPGERSGSYEAWEADLHPDDRECTLALLEDMLARRSASFAAEYRIRGKSGEWMWVLDRGKVVEWSAAGRAVRAVGTLTDITRRKQLEDVVRERETSFRLLFEANPVPMWVYDRNSLRFLEVNAAAVEHYGYSREQFLAMTVLDIRPEDDRERMFAIAANTSCSRGRAGLSRHITADGRTIVVDVSADRVLFRGCNAALVACVDVTSRIEAQTALERSESAMRGLLQQRSTTLDALPAHIALVDAEGTIRLVNKAWRTFAAANGLVDAGAGVGTNYLTVCDASSADSEDSRLAASGLRDVLAGDRETFALDYSCHSPAERRWFRFMAASISPGQGQGAVVMHVDITASKLAEEALAHARERAEAASRTKSEFLANMSHELRTPLNAIIGFSDLMKSEMFGPLGTASYREYATDIHASGTHLLALINDILDLSKIEAGRFEVSLEPVALGPVVEGCLALIRPRAELSEVSLTAEIPPDLPALWADERRFRQILLNLLSNAVKFTLPGGHVRVSACRDGDAIVTEVADTGIGMSPDDIAASLEPFQQIESALSRRYEGTGLGLPLASRLAAMQDGRLEIQSAAGVGTTVTVTLPCAVASAKRLQIMD